MSFAPHEKPAQKALTVPRMSRRTFSRINLKDIQTVYGAYIRLLPEYANQPVYSGHTKDVTLIERAQRAATKMGAGLKSVDYETHLAALDIFPLEYRRLRGDLILTYSLFEQGLANRFSTIDPENTHRGHGERQPLNDKNKTDPGNLGKSFDPVCQHVNPCHSSTFNLKAQRLPGKNRFWRLTTVCMLLCRLLLQADGSAQYYMPVSPSRRIIGNYIVLTQSDQNPKKKLGGEFGSSRLHPTRISYAHPFLCGMRLCWSSSTARMPRTVYVQRRAKKPATFLKGGLGDVIPFGHVTNISKDKRYQGVSSELKETRKSPQGSFFDDSLCTLTSLYRFHKLPLTNPMWWKRIPETGLDLLHITFVRM
ncbi:hypothetical protein CLF_105833 [Clonorchis sinensis]|uniref:Uncharacterized protein n=1 Tax=Clonorchis sinensis TaxID=79923 RepID=G7YPG5_CLOSI|nr:hypothetical protein CLF_105833 [Clonorchis sinensis]